MLLRYLNLYVYMRYIPDNFPDSMKPTVDLSVVFLAFYYRVACLRDNIITLRKNLRFAIILIIISQAKTSTLAEQISFV